MAIDSPPWTLLLPAGDDLGDIDDDHCGEDGEADADDNDKGLTYNGQ